MTKTAKAARKKPTSVTDQLTAAIVSGMQEKKAKGISILDLRGLNGAAVDVFVICQGDSSTQVEAVSRSVVETVEKIIQEKPAHTEGMKNAKWVLIDYISVVAHIFQPDQRAYYGIERLWADAEITEIPD